MMNAVVDETLKPVDVIAHADMPVAGLFQLILGHYGTVAISTFARLGIADAMSDATSYSAGELAAESGADERGLYRLLRTLSTLGVVQHCADNTFVLTEAGSHLRADNPFSLRHIAMMHGAQWHWDPWARAMDAVRKGRAQFQEHHGVSYYGYVDANPVPGMEFAQGMSDLAVQVHTLALPMYDFSRHRRIVDVAGGEGVVLSLILESCPEATGVLFDLPSVVDSARARLKQSGVSDRAECIDGDMFTSVPEGGDCYVLSMILNDYDREAAGRILANCRTAMAPGGSLVVLDMVIPENGTPSFAKLGDFECLVVSGGELRTESELSELLADHGFDVRAVNKGISPVRIVEAVAR